MNVNAVPQREARLLERRAAPHLAKFETVMASPLNAAQHTIRFPAELPIAQYLGAATQATNNWARLGTCR
jgi:hypothetical protein